MVPLVLLGLLAAASAAPQFFDRHGGWMDHFPHHGYRSPYIQDDLFDTGRFWSDLSSELKQLDDMLADFSRRFPSSVSNQGIEGKEYKITVPLTGFDEKDIVVKAKEGLLMVQAVHKADGGNERNYLDVRTLPTCVNVTGTWTFADDVLKIVFPLKATSENPVEETTEVVSTEGYKEQSREEIDTNREQNNVNADVGLERGDHFTEIDKQIATNEIPRNNIEATTYAVNLKDEVEFVPVPY